MAEEKKKDDTKSIDLEVCVNKEWAQIDLPECKECEGYNYNCTSYYPLEKYCKVIKKGYKI
jgi:Na+-translocating ferredoxin:NAD+ oxidoreductase RnfC subunit